MKIIILSNPSSGGGKARPGLLAAVEALRRKGEEPQIHESQNAQHLLELARQASAEKPDVLVSAGGDGTLHQVLNGVVPGQAPVGIIPVGRGNDLARSLGIPSDPVAAAEMLLTGKSKAIDLAGASEGGGQGNHAAPILYAGIAGVGFDSVATRYANDPARRNHGRFAYAWGILRCLGSYRPQPVEIVSDARNFSGEVMFAVAANNSSYGLGVKIAPRAALDDGMLDVCIIPAMSKWELLRWVPAAYRGEHLAHPDIIYFQARRVTLRSPARLDLFGDGEFLRELPATIESQPGALRVIVPP